MDIKDLRKIIRKNNRYKNFTLLENPVKFCDMQAGNNIDMVQIHSTQTFGNPADLHIVGFAGQFSWKDNTIIPLDGDSYNPEMTVYGYEWFENKEKGINRGLDILVDSDW